jgi:hypothetical protein
LIPTKKEAISKAEKEMDENGIMAVGDIVIPLTPSTSNDKPDLEQLY